MSTVLHDALCARHKEVVDWFRSKKEDFAFPVYMSVDVRDGGFKVSAVDANIYPAGFNNICHQDRERAPEVLQRYLDRHYGTDFKKIALVTEEHTKNSYYWENVKALIAMIEGSGREVRVTVPRTLARTVQVPASGGGTVELFPAVQKDGRLVVGDGFEADLIISNNDFSEAREEWAKGLTTPLNPPRELGWYQRKKSRHFRFYNELAEELALVIGLDPWMLQTRTDLFVQFDPESQQSMERLAVRVDEMIETIGADYTRNGIDKKPVVFIKNNAGTYGLSVTSVHSGREVLEWSGKNKKKMEAAKGGGDVNEVILQEGIPTILAAEGGGSAEPTIYMLGCELIGGFLRTHKDKGPDESLNSPGAIFKRLCMSDLEVKRAGCPMENAYGSVARLAALAISREIEEMQVQFSGYKVQSCG